MAVPKFYEFLKPFLQVIDDGNIHSSNDVCNQIATVMHISKEDQAEMLPSQRQTTFKNRVHWARAYLDKAGLIETPNRGQYRITALGQEALKSGQTIDVSYLMQFDSFKKFHGSVKPPIPHEPHPPIEEPPTETLDEAYERVIAALADELMDEVKKLSSVDFEKLVVKLLLKMGYGSGIDNAGIVTPASHDGGIDGIIKEDQLGFSNIYIQAKKWENAVSKPDIQQFVGALSGQGAQKGLFITTANFSDGARKYAENLTNLKIVLIDGNILTRLMIKYNVGVTVEHIYELKRLDRDFFDEEL